MNSFVAPPFINPYGTFVKVRGNAEQRAAEEIKTKPKNADANGKLNHRKHPREGTARRVRLDGQLAQAIGANDAVIVLGDAFAAIEVAAFRAARHSFAQRMLKATLMNELRHYESAAGRGGAVVIVASCSRVVSPCAAVIIEVRRVITFLELRKRRSGGNGCMATAV